jgi:hypothetical protein
MINNIKITALFYFTMGSLIIGFLLIGIGITLLFDKCWCIGALIGAGLGLVLSTFISLKVLNNMQIYNKNVLGEK